jgi:deoxyribonuclease-4
VPLRIGAHVRGGLSRIVTSAREVGAEAIQIFASNSRAWGGPPSDPRALEAIGDEVTEAGLGPFFVHSPYLVNPASPNEVFLQRSTQTLAWTFQRAALLGAQGVVVHAGAAGTTTPRTEALRRVRESLLPLADASTVTMVIELTAGGSGAIASRWLQARELLDALQEHPSIRFCFDTCHAFAAGYDLATPEGMRACLNEMRREIGVERLALVHANDSRDPLGSRRDRHEHLGRGTMGLEGFRALVRSGVARRVPLIVETPPEGQPADIALLRGLAKG